MRRVGVERGALWQRHERHLRLCRGGSGSTSTPPSLAPPRSSPCPLHPLPMLILTSFRILLFDICGDWRLWTRLVLSVSSCFPLWSCRAWPFLLHVSFPSSLLPILNSVNIKMMEMPSFESASHRLSVASFRHPSVVSFFSPSSSPSPPRRTAAQYKLQLEHLGRVQAVLGASSDNWERVQSLLPNALVPTSSRLPALPESHVWYFVLGRSVEGA